MIWTQLSFSFVSSLFPLTCLSMAIWALVSSYRTRIREKCFQTSSAHKANDLSSDASNTTELWCFLQNNLAVYWDSGWVGAVHPLMLPTASLLYSCHWPPVVSWKQVRELRVCMTDPSRHMSPPRDKTGEHALRCLFIMASVNAGRWLVKLRKHFGSFCHVEDAPSHSN